MLLRIVVNYKTLKSYKKWMNLKLEVKLKKILKICPQLRLRNYLLKMKEPQATDVCKVTTMKINGSSSSSSREIWSLRSITRWKV